MAHENSSSKEGMVAAALTNGGAKLIALVVNQAVEIKSGDGGLTLPEGSYALVALPATQAKSGVYLLGGEPKLPPKGDIKPAEPPDDKGGAT